MQPVKSTTVKVCGREVYLFNDEEFSLCRKHYGILDNFLESGWDMENDLKKSEGKGGDLMAMIGDSYVVKQLSKGDHETLLKISGKLVNHVISEPSLITPVFLHWLHHDGRFFYAQARTCPSGAYKAIYDLKGCDDDKTMMMNGRKVQAVHKRWYNLCMWCGSCAWTSDRVTYFEGKLKARAVKFAVTEEQRKEILTKIQYDIEFFKRVGLMDYSLLVAQLEGPSGSFGTPLHSFQKPVVSTAGTQDTATYLSIIDYLQEWNLSKTLANMIKVLERNKATIKPSPYADRFYEQFENRFYDPSKA